MFTQSLLYFTLTCMAGTTCPQEQAVSARTYRTTLACERAATAVAQEAFYREGARYSYRCAPVAFQPSRTAD